MEKIGAAFFHQPIEKIKIKIRLFVSLLRKMLDKIYSVV